MADREHSRTSQRRLEAMHRSFPGNALRAAFAFLLALVFVAPATAQTDQERLVNDARTTLNNFMSDPAQTWIHDNIHRARAILISPQIVRAGFIFGGSGGRAVLIAHNGPKWVGPAFYNLATASVGFQAGIDVSEAVIMVMTERGLNSLMSNTFRIGGDASVAAGPVGAGARSSVEADLVSFTRAKGLYGGLNLDGTVVTANNDWNNAFFHSVNLTPPDILIRNKVHNAKAQPLLDDVARVMRTK
jgi:SH3 domain-containing YSC84-like protein 1